MASDQKEKIYRTRSFFTQIISKNTEKKTPGVTLKYRFHDLKDPPSGPYFLCCPINVDNNNTNNSSVVLCLGWVGLWVESINFAKEGRSISYSYSNPSEYYSVLFTFEHHYTRTAGDRR